MLTQLVMIGTWVSLMVTVNVQALVLPLVSAALQVTGVTPLLKVVPEAGEQALVTPGQLSVAVKVQVTLAFEQRLLSVEATILAGQVTTGGTVSTIATLKAHVWVRPLGAV